MGLCADRICHAPVSVSGLFELWPFTPLPFTHLLVFFPPPLPTTTRTPPSYAACLSTAECIWELPRRHGLLWTDRSHHRQSCGGPERCSGGGTDLEGKKEADERWDELMDLSVTCSLIHFEQMLCPEVKLNSQCTITYFQVIESLPFLSQTHLIHSIL